MDKNFYSSAIFDFFMGNNIELGILSVDCLNSNSIVISTQSEKFKVTVEDFKKEGE